MGESVIPEEKLVRWATRLYTKIRLYVLISTVVLVI